MQPRVSITLCCIVLGIVIHSVPAATVIAADHHSDQIQTRNTTIHYDIPAGSLIDALSRFARQSGVAISIKADQLKGLQTPGLTGSYSIETGFATLLAGSGYQIRKTDAGYVLQRAPIITGQTLPLMTVSTASLKQGTTEEGYRVSNISGIGLWDERSLRDTPYSMSIVPSDLIENINAQNMGQIFKMNPLTQEPNIQNFTGVPFVTIRGFQSANPIYDGIPMAAGNGSAVSVIEIDRVEILSGTSGFLYGGGRVGGAINYVTKSPTDIPLRRLTRM
ncbi:MULTISPECIES: TonB-dependent receptor [Nitrosomonas]|uniref:TonB-dependent receptor n=1 Tax=Nitrosomonas TaxID=914 RepID=UPI0000191D65|nr:MULTISPECIES: TonB-dependent receptor plug domain-containing protein [Nitrosomonas]SDW55694.1 iron complex outermembrane recepter protein [Nitrosomonas europaea]SET16768.1 iron complex outermembrane recepter protein [Nitrosomonas europaea]SJZ65790.1 Secretin and TonB N terminus short domain-containing protein [Nitrosomonas europaea]HBF25530.1 hypothetical protein [Nitrosomonas sp.]